MKLTDEAPAFAALLCARCGTLRAEGAESCARCGAAPIGMRWAGAPARDNWFDAGFRAALGGAVWPGVGASAAFSVALLASGFVPAGLVLATPALAAAWRRRAVHGWVLDQLAVAFGKFWRWVATDGSGRGAMVTLGARRIAGFGAWLERVEELKVDVPAPSARDVVAAGPAAVARALGETWQPLSRPLEAAHVLVLAAFAREVARGALRVWHAERWRWFQHSAHPQVELHTGSSTPPLLVWARGPAPAPEAGTLEAALLEALADQQTRRGSAGLLVGGPRLPGRAGDPYRASGFDDTPPPAEPIKLTIPAIGDLLVKLRAAPSSPDCATVAAQLAALAHAAPFLATQVVAEAENLRIAWFDG